MSQSNEAKQDKSIGTQLLIAGSAACLADFATFPLDTAKVRLQLQGENTTTAPRVTPSNNNTQSLLKTFTKRPLATATPTNTILATGRCISTAYPVTTEELSSHVQSQTQKSLQKSSNFQYRGLFGTISTIARQEGPRSLYNGLSAGLQRQMVFASVRLGMYDSVKEFYQNLFNERPDGLNVGTRVLAGITTGGLAVCVGQPTEVVKIKFQAQKRVAGAAVQKLEYTSTPATYRRIGREEGIRGLWKGAIPNIGRNAVVNVSEIVVYDVVKDCLIVYGEMRDNIYCHFTAAVIAGN